LRTVGNILYARSHIHTDLHTYMHKYIQTYIHIYVHTCIHVFIHTFLGTYISIHKHKYIYKTWLLFIFCLQQVDKHMSGSVWSEVMWILWSVSCWAGRCVILHCKVQYSLFHIW